MVEIQRWEESQEWLCPSCKKLNSILDTNFSITNCEGVIYIKCRFCNIALLVEDDLFVANKECKK